MNQAPHHESESHALLCLRNHNKAPLGGERSARLRGIPNGIAALLTVPFFLCMAVFACLLNLANDVTAQEKPAAEAKASEKTADEKKPATTEQPAATKDLFISAFGAGAKLGFLLPYSRLHESEADRIGLIFMAMAGYDPREAASFWQRMAELKEGAGPPEFLSTHPSDETRTANLKRLAEEEAMQYYKPQAPPAASP